MLHLRGMLPAITVAAAVVFWLADLGQRAASNEFTTLFAQRRPPFLMPGLRLDFGEAVEFSDNRAALAQGSPITRRVVLVTSDTCRFCREVQPGWCRILERTKFPDSDELLFVTYAGPSIPTTLSACAQKSGTGARRTIVTVLNPTAFGTRTGILGTPAILVTTSGGVLIRAFSGARADALELAVHTGIELTRSSFEDERLPGGIKKEVGG